MAVARKPTFSEADWKGNGPVLHALGVAHGFTPAELEANRGGQLHPDQLARGLSLGRTDVRFGTVLLTIGLVLLVAGLAVPWFPRALKDLDFHFAVPPKLGVALFVGLFLGGLLGSVPLVLGFAALKHGRRVIGFHLPGRVEAAVGTLEKLVVRRSRSGDACFYVIGNLRLAVDRKAWDGIKGGRYRVHYVNGVFRVLSLEPA